MWLGVDCCPPLRSGFPAPAPNRQPTKPTGEIKGDAWVHTPESLSASAQQADICLPAAATGGAVFCGKLNALPSLAKGKPVPVVLFLHGSSGLGLKAIGEWQRWLAGLGVASVAPDSWRFQG